MRARRLVTALLAVAVGAGSVQSGAAAAPLAEPAVKAKKCKKASKKKSKKKKKKGGEGPLGPPVGTTITLDSYETGAQFDQLRGTIASPVADCVSEARAVGLFEGDPPFGKQIGFVFPVAGKLTFTFPSETSGDRFYAFAEGGLVGDSNCDSAVSNTIARP